MRNYLQLGLVLTITIALLAGCGVNKTTVEPGYVQLTIDGQTVNCNAGLSNSPFEGKCLGGYVNSDANDNTIMTVIYGSVSATSAMFENSPKIQSIVMIIETMTTVSDYEANIIYCDGTTTSESIGSATITQYDAVGGRIKGTFSGTINGKSITGSFNVKR
jgi:hypothetical protein